MDLKSIIRTIPDYPKPGIMFRDVTTLLEDPVALGVAVSALAEPFRGQHIAQVAGIEARGFIFGAAVAIELGAGFIPLRKPGKLPRETLSEPYDLEYGTDELHIHADSIEAGESVVLIDDLIATGGTALAGLRLLNRVKANVLGAGFVIDLPDLGGANALRTEGLTVNSLIEFEGH